jgi:hypothetical protein
MIAGGDHIEGDDGATDRGLIGFILNKTPDKWLLVAIMEMVVTGRSAP